MNVQRRYLVGVIAALVLFILLREPEPVEVTQWRVARVPTAEFEAREPDTDRSLLEKATTRVVEPDHVAIADLAATDLIDRFVRIAAQPVTSVPAPSQPRVPGVATPMPAPAAERMILHYGGRLTRDGLELYSVNAADRSKQMEYFAETCPPLEWLAIDDRTSVQAGRWCRLRTWSGVLGVAGLAFGLGSGSLEIAGGGAAVLVVREIVF